MSDVGGVTDPVSEENRVHICDTTLRDGEQSPGISLNAQEKVEIAQQLARLGVDVVEAGFPITSPGDFEAVEAIAHRVEGPVICGLSRTQLHDVDRCAHCITPCARRRRALDSSRSLPADEQPSSERHHRGNPGDAPPGTRRQDRNLDGQRSRGQPPR